MAHTILWFKLSQTKCMHGVETRKVSVAKARALARESLDRNYYLSKHLIRWLKLNAEISLLQLLRRLDSYIRSEITLRANLVSEMEFFEVR